MRYELWVMGYGLRVMGYGLWVMGYGLWVMGYVLHGATKYVDKDARYEKTLRSL